ncbi:MAG: epoxyqueuosine reductase [Candidatus Hodarchaeales archaeon]|jgi:epoxyqueuosine reductase QueG
METNIKNNDIWVESIIKNFLNESPLNTLKNESNERAWAEPIVGFSNGADILYQFYKEDIGDFYLLPHDILSNAYPGARIEPDQITVIAWVLPQTDVTKSEHRNRTEFPTERWARARIYGEEVNNELRKHVVNKLKGKGYEAVAPMLSPLWDYHWSDKYLNSSNWSERHAAYASGLGTFGLCDGLITPKGKAMRCGSVVVKIAITPSNRSYNDHHAYCLFFSKGTCRKCMDRCPVGAITESGHDKTICRTHLQETAEYVKKNYDFDGYGCGLCQTGVPCESGIPIESNNNVTKIKNA